MNIRCIVPLIMSTPLAVATCDMAEPEQELPTAHVRVCLTPDAIQSYAGDCSNDGYWANERTPTRNGAIPLEGIPIRICSFSNLIECREGTGGVIQILVTDSEGYVAFPGLAEGWYVFYSEMSEAKMDSCTIIPKDRYGGALKVEPRILTTPVEYQNGHIGELWFVTRNCEEDVSE